MSNRSSTVTIELRDDPIHNSDRLVEVGRKTSDEPGPSRVRQVHQGRPPSSRATPSQDEPHGRTQQEVSSLPPPAMAPPQQDVNAERWNQPRSNITRTLAAFWSLLVMGMNDAAYGAIIPYMAPYYHLSYTTVSLIFLSPFVGYTLAAFLNTSVHQRLGRRGVAAICSASHAAAYAAASAHPPYPVLVVIYMLAGFGNGIGDAAWSAWAGSMASGTDELLGLLHACYGAGGVLAPLVATSLVARAGTQWFAFYYVMLGAAGLEAVVTVTAFWADTGRTYREQSSRPVAETTTTTTSGAGAGGSRMREALLRMPAARVTWLCAAYLLCYLGVGVSLGGWIVQFMIDVRDGGAFASGLVATGFWLGLTVGRVVLGFVTPKIGERLAPMVSGRFLLLNLFWFLFHLLPQSNIKDIKTHHFGS